MTDTALLPCPFCGGEAERYTIMEGDEVANVGGDVISCTKCGASSHVEFGEKENLLDTWNRRASPSQVAPANPAQVTELPDDLRLPLHSLQADLDYLLARYAAEDDEVRGMLKDSIRNRLSQIEEASYRHFLTAAIGAGGQAVADDAWKDITEGSRVVCTDYGTVQSIDEDGNAEVLWDISGCIGDIDLDRLRPALSQPHPADARVVEALRKARQLVDIATDWNLDEVEIDGEMVKTHSLGSEFDTVLAILTAKEGR